MIIEKIFRPEDKMKGKIEEAIYRFIYGPADIPEDPAACREEKKQVLPGNKKAIDGACPSRMMTEDAFLKRS